MAKLILKIPESDLQGQDPETIAKVRRALLMLHEVITKQKPVTPNDWLAFAIMLTAAVNMLGTLMLYENNLEYENPEVYRNN